jgi:hypothetical protein
MKWGKCKKCNGDLDMHGNKWCPKCDKPKAETCVVLDFLKVARYIAEHEGYPYKDDGSVESHRNTWVYRLMNELEFPGNDCYISWYMLIEDEYEEDERDSLTWQFDQGLRKHYGFKDDELVILNISW